MVGLPPKHSARLPGMGRSGTPLRRGYSSAAALESRREPQSLDRACGLKLAGDPPRKGRDLARGGLPLGADDELRPPERGVGVAGGELPDRSLAAVQAPDEEAVEPDQVARPGRLDVRLRFGLARGFIGRPVSRR